MTALRLLATTTPLLLALAVPAAFSATAVSGSVGLTATAVAGGDPVVVTDAQAWSGIPADLAASATATASGSNYVNTASGSIAARWTGADAGSVVFTDYGWDMPGLGATGLTGSTDWTYTFTATSDGTFTMAYSVLGEGDTFGLWGWTISVPGDVLYVSNVADPSTVGSLSGALVAGQTYTVSLINNANIIGGFATGHMDGEFDWSITSSVPETGSLALMLAGLGALLVAARRRRE